MADGPGKSHRSLAHTELPRFFADGSSFLWDRATVAGGAASGALRSDAPRSPQRSALLPLLVAQRGRPSPEMGIALIARRRASRSSSASCPIPPIARCCTPLLPLASCAPRMAESPGYASLSIPPTMATAIPSNGWAIAAKTHNAFGWPPPMGSFSQTPMVRALFHSLQPEWAKVR